MSVPDRRTGRLVALVAVLAAGIVPAGAATAPSPLAGTRNIPVAATFDVVTAYENHSPAHGIVHAVRRVEGATVLYWSEGFATERASFNGAQPEPSMSDRWKPTELFAPPALLDTVGLKAYTTLVTEDGGSCLCTPLVAPRDEAGTMFVFYNVYPPLPPETRTVSVRIGLGTVIADVPVTVGPLLPAVDPANPIVLGQGWPRVDPAAVAAAPDKDRSVSPLQSRLEDVADHLTTVQAPAQVSVELSTDVLFAVDSAVLNPAAQATVARAAAIVNERAKGGTIAVTGHTDNTGTDAHNDVLSLQRAQAVRAALAPLVTVAGVTYTVEGHGEREPVADNSSDAGRQANRRVAVAFAPKD
ncbi:MAG TPA: OmpA family protein [Acidimicrobiales bacterium]|nr:OmpA family protein [Acidimicrobiales bacterium]